MLMLKYQNWWCIMKHKILAKEWTDSAKEMPPKEMCYILRIMYKIKFLKIIISRLSLEHSEIVKIICQVVGHISR